MTNKQADSFSQTAYMWLQQQLGSGSKVTELRSLKGGISTSLFEVHYISNNQMEKAVLRLYDNTVWLAEEPDLLEHEKTSLQTLRSQSIKAPYYIASEKTGSVFGYQAILMSYLEGEMKLTQYRPQHYVEMVKPIIHLHELPVTELAWSYEPYTDVTDAKVPEWTHVPQLWSKMLHLLAEAPPEHRLCRIHRDYHPSNLLWVGDQVSGVVDWINSCIGPAGIDISHCRVNLAFLHGVNAANAFLDAYKVEVNEHSYYDRYWDLRVFADFVYPGPPEVYKGWTDMGVKGLNTDLMIQRADEFLIEIFSGGIESE